ncbi:hypothetical protein DOTSEDRAFT_70048 [Dothistroma septosporum NZE10]|uniref:Uncharacterized protein n=1 Tax=Dothistroma septosporum (strain NZE10 / CBS 128990) TaxID=675120 RepID=N1PR66_DOTSN|nr:hypothetical protein DOTSEDRAFT_70048 [Dothistroma septosporum NZE10]
MESALCQWCRNFNLEERHLDPISYDCDGVEFPLTIQDIERCASTCSCCRLILDALSTAAAQARRQSTSIADGDSLKTRRNNLRTLFSTCMSYNSNPIGGKRCTVWSYC